MYPNGPGSTPLSLGAVTFFSAECPEVLPIGGVEQMEVVHTLVGGGRVVQSFGVSAKEVSWSGKLFDQNVALRCQQLRLYVVSAKEILLSWGSERYYCKVKSFEPKMRGGYAEYEITLTITKDANGAFSVASSLSIDKQVQALAAQASFANQDILAPINQANLSSTTANLPTIDPAALAAANGASGYQQYLQNLFSTINNAGPIAKNITTSGPSIISSANLASSAIGSFIAKIGPSSPAFASALLLQSSVSAIATNVKLGQSPSSIVAQGTSLFHVSSMQFGDITQAFNLATANGLVSPFLSSLSSTKLNLPPLGA